LQQNNKKERKTKEKKEEKKKTKDKIKKKKKPSTLKIFLLYSGSLSEFAEGRIFTSNLKKYFHETPVVSRSKRTKSTRRNLVVSAW